MKKTLIVARHEFTTTVKRLAFILITFAMPLVLGGVMLISTLASQKTVEAQLARPSQAKLYIVDGSGRFGGPFPEGRGEKWKRVATEEEAREIIRKEKDATAIIIPAPRKIRKNDREEETITYLDTGEIRVFTSIPPSLFSEGRSLVPADFRRWMSKQLAGTVSEKELARALRPVASESVVYLVRTKKGIHEEDWDEFFARMMSGIAFFATLFMAISVSGGYLVQGLADEKENRVLEMVLSSVTPSQLMFGKLIGLGGAGLLQVAIWSCMGIITLLNFLSAFVLNPLSFFLCGILFLLGYLLYGSMMLGLGSLGSTVRESHQYTAIVTIFAISPLFFWMTILTDPQGAIARVMSYIPFTAPVTMMLRYTVDPSGTPAWEVALIFAILLFSTWLGVKFAARLYRMGLLLYGKRPTPREILRWLRTAGS